MPTHVGNGEDTQTGPSGLLFQVSESQPNKEAAPGPSDLLYHLLPLAQVRAF